MGRLVFFQIYERWSLNIIIRMQLITLLQNNSISSLSQPPVDKDSHESDTTSDSSFDQHPDDSPLIFKKSLASTHFTSCSLDHSDLEDSEQNVENEEDQPCRDFFSKGCCTLGSGCAYSHRDPSSQNCKRKRKIYNQILGNFPSIVVGCFTRRINSFLQ